MEFHRCLYIVTLINLYQELDQNGNHRRLTDNTKVTVATSSSGLNALAKCPRIIKPSESEEVFT